VFHQAQACKWPPDFAQVAPNKAAHNYEQQGYGPHNCLSPTASSVQQQGAVSKRVCVNLGLDATLKKQLPMCKHLYKDHAISNRCGANIPKPYSGTISVIQRCDGSCESHLIFHF
jgi:hypothetical protein